MTRSTRSTRQRLILAALQLFAAQGIVETTTRQIAELANVNEVTLFRQFGSKYGLLLAAMEDTKVFTRLGATLGQQASQMQNMPEALRNYVTIGLQALEQIPELVRSLIGGAGHYPPENREALGRGLTQANRYTAQYLTTVMNREQIRVNFPAEKLASLLNSLLLGYLVLKLSSDGDELWQDRDDFLEDLVNLFLNGAVVHSSLSATAGAANVSGTKTPAFPEVRAIADLPGALVHNVLRNAKKAGLQDFALAYVLFGAGLNPGEIAALERSHSISDVHQHLVQVPQGRIRQVPLNQWIMGRRYGSHMRNPLIQWLKSRKDSRSALFVNETGNPISELEIRLQWQLWTDDLLTPEGYPPALEQAYDTWCVEMLMKGVTSEALSILTGRGTTDLQPYVRRAREKAALEQAIRLDQKPTNVSAKQSPTEPI